MGITLIDSDGDSFDGGKIDSITTKLSTKTTALDLPSADKDVVMKFGKRNREFTCKGYVTGSAGVTFLEDALNETGSLSFVSEAMGNQTIISAVTVFYQNLQWIDRGDRPMERFFTIECVEII